MTVRVVRIVRRENKIYVYDFHLASHPIQNVLV